MVSCIAIQPMFVQSLSTLYGQALVKQHLGYFDLVFSAGPYCRLAFHIRRLFSQSEAFPFDWWLTPASSFLRMIDPGYYFNLSTEQIFLSLSGQVVLNSRDLILHLHDFERLPSGDISLANIESQLDAINEKYRFLFNRLRERLKKANRCLIILEGLMPATELEQYRLRTECHELLYPRITNGYAEELVQMLKDNYKVEATLACFHLGAPKIEQQKAILNISAPVLTSVFDDDAEPYQQPWASYDILFAQLCAALSEGNVEKFL